MANTPKDHSAAVKILCVYIEHKRKRNKAPVHISAKLADLEANLANPALDRVFLEAPHRFAFSQSGPVQMLRPLPPTSLSSRQSMESKGRARDAPTSSSLASSSSLALSRIGSKSRRSPSVPALKEGLDGRISSGSLKEGECKVAVVEKKREDDMKPAGNLKDTPKQLSLSPLEPSSLAYTRPTLPSLTSSTTTLPSSPTSTVSSNASKPHRYFSAHPPYPRGPPPTTALPTPPTSSHSALPPHRSRESPQTPLEHVSQLDSLSPKKSSARRVAIESADLNVLAEELEKIGRTTVVIQEPGEDINVGRK